MDLYGNHTVMKQAENFGTPNKHSSQMNLSPGATRISPSYRVVVSTPKSKPLLITKTHRPSSIPRIKPVLLSTSIRVSPEKSLGKFHITSHNYCKKTQNKESYFSCADTRSSGVSQQLFTTKRAPTESKSSRLYINQDTKYGQAYSISKSSIQLPHMNSKKGRKPISLDTFQPHSKQQKCKENFSFTNEDKSLTHQRHEDRSEFSDWEFIDWPWVTPYAPLNQITFFPGTRSFNILSASEFKRHVPFYLRNPVTPPLGIKSIYNRQERAPIALASNQKLLNSRREFSNPPLLTSDQVGWTDAKLRAIKDERIENIFPRRRALTISEPIPETVISDPAIISVGPVHSVQNENSKKIDDQQAECDKTNTCEELCDKVFQKCTKEIIKCVTQLRKQDELMIKRLLQTFQEKGTHDRLCCDFSYKSDQNHNMKEPETLQKHLNPNVPEFQPKNRYIFEDYTELDKLPLQQTTNRNRFPLQEAESHNRYKENMGSFKLQVKRQIPSIKTRPNRTGNYVTRLTREPFCPRASPNKVDNIEEILIETCLKKIRILESEVRQQSERANGMPYTLQTPRQYSSISNPPNDITFDIETDENGPGRVANAMEQTWAAQMLEKFRGKYPMTGAVRSDPITDVKKKLVGDCQQRLEYLLLARKENMNNQRYYYRGFNQGNSWSG